MEEAACSLQSLSLGVDHVPEIPPPSSPLMNKLPVELRLTIFGFALRAEGGVARLNVLGSCTEERLESARINVALLTVSRQVSTEALEAFYNVNTIQADTLDVIMLGRCREARHLTFTNAVRFDLFQNGPGPIRDLAGIFGWLHKLKSITIHCDGLARECGHTVRTWATTPLRVGGDQPPPVIHVRCLEIGLFEIELPEEMYEVEGDKRTSGHIYYKNAGLYAAFPPARELATHRGLLELLLISSLCRLAEEKRAEAEKVQTQLHCEVQTQLHCAMWLVQYEVYRAMRSGDMSAYDRLLDSEQELMRSLVKEEMSDKTSLPRIHPSLPPNVKLQDITLEEHGAELLEWASELLSVNVCTQYSTLS